MGTAQQGSVPTRTAGAPHLVLPWLDGWFVVEAGRRQAWPFLTLAAPEAGTEVRLYIDATFSVDPGWDAVRQDDDALVALDSLNGLTIVSSRSGDDGLRVDLGAATLQVQPRPNELTTHAVWWTGPGAAQPPAP